MSSTPVIQPRVANGVLTPTDLAALLAAIFEGTTPIISLPSGEVTTNIASFTLNPANGSYNIRLTN